MADVKSAIEFVLRQEDSRLTGKVTTLAGDSGGATRYGIASRFHPELIATGFFDESKTDSGRALLIALGVYDHTYAAPLHIAQIQHQGVATALLSFGINAGTNTAAETIQRACSALGQTIGCDGDLGTKSLTAINTLPGPALLNQFITSAEAHYRELVETNPTDAVFLHGWLNRAEAWRSLA
jgi:lysozyme family protein